MSLQVPLFTVVNNDAVFYPNVTLNGSALDLTGFTPTAYLKSAATVADDTGLSYTIDSGISVINPSLGQLEWDIPHADLATAAIMWWRLDLMDGSGNIFTSMYGPFTIKAA